jgi:hypothetical protein
MPRHGRCRCGALLTFQKGPHGFKTRCPACNAVVRMRPPGKWKPAPEPPPDDLHLPEGGLGHRPAAASPSLPAVPLPAAPEAPTDFEAVELEPAAPAPPATGFLGGVRVWLIVLAGLLAVGGVAGLFWYLRP